MLPADPPSDLPLRPAASTRALLAHPGLALALLAGLSALVYALAFVGPAFLPALYPGARPDFFTLHAPGSPAHLALLLAFAFLGLVYLAAWRLAQHASGLLAWAVVIGGSLLFGAILVWLFPYDAADIFDYIIHGRMTGVYGVNPYRLTPNQFPHDPFYPYVAWKSDPSPYGPLWELIAGLAARLGRGSFLGTVLLYKLAVGLFLLASLGLVALILRRAAPRLALAGTLLLAWNPVVLYETWGNGHNDMVMVFWLLAAAWAMQRRRYTTAVLALAAGALVKFVPLLLLPAAGLIALAGLSGLWRRVSFLVRSGLAVLALAALAYAPFWYGPQVFTVANRTHLFTASIPAALYYLLKTRLPEATAAGAVSLVALGLTAVFALWQGWRAARLGEAEPDRRLAQAGFNILTFYLLVTCLWFQQWYTLWLIGLAPLLASSAGRRLAILFGFAALSKQLVLGPALFWPRPWLQQPWLEVCFTLGILIIPWTYALQAILRSRARSRSALLPAGR